MKTHPISTTLRHYFGIQRISTHPISSPIQNRRPTTSWPSIAGDRCTQEHFCPLLFNSLTFNMVWFLPGPRMEKKHSQKKREYQRLEMQRYNSAVSRESRLPKRFNIHVELDTSYVMDSWYRNNIHSTQLSAHKNRGTAQKGKIMEKFKLC